MRLALPFSILMALTACSHVESNAAGLHPERMIAVATWPEITTLDAKDKAIVLQGFRFTIASPRYFAGRRLRLWVDSAIKMPIQPGDAVELDLSGIELTNENGVWNGYPTKGFPFEILPSQSSEPALSSGTPPAGQERAVVRTVHLNV
jgi:hypothetical protein